MKRATNLYRDLANFYHIVDMTDIVCRRVRNKKKVDKFESFKSEHIYHIYHKLKKKDFKIGKYNIFMINDPKCRIVMSQDIEDKIINHLVSLYALKKVFDSKYTNVLCATRTGYGTLYGIKRLKKYLIEMNKKYDNLYILKIDIHKYFYSMDHEILKTIIKRKIKDKDVLNLLNKIIDSTNEEYINNKIRKLKKNRIDYLKNSNLTNKNQLIKEVEEIPLYEVGKGVALGNETSQCFGLIYLYEIAHYIREDLKLSRICIYMDDFIIVHEDKEYLKYCLEKIIDKLREYKLDINLKKTRIDSIKNGIDFLGYRFFISNNKIIMKLRTRTKKKYKRKIRKAGLLYRNNIIDEKDFFIGLNSYNGMLKWGNCGRLKKIREVRKILEKYYKVKINHNDYICMIKVGSFYEVFDNDALIINELLKYKVKVVSNTFKVGFPINSIKNVTKKLKEESINYIVVDNDLVLEKKVYNKNGYKNYHYDKEILTYQCMRIDHIMKYLDNNRMNDNIRDKIKRIEEVISM